MTGVLLMSATLPLGLPNDIIILLGVVNSQIFRANMDDCRADKVHNFDDG